MVAHPNKLLKTYIDEITQNRSDIGVVPTKVSLILKLSLRIIGISNVKCSDLFHSLMRVITSAFIEI